jgi:hypothetical protein
MPKTIKGSRRHIKSKSKTNINTKPKQKYSSRHKKQSGGSEHMDILPKSLLERQKLEQRKLQESLRLRQQQQLQLYLQEKIKKKIISNSRK